MEIKRIKVILFEDWIKLSRIELTLWKVSLPVGLITHSILKTEIFYKIESQPGQSCISEICTVSPSLCDASNGRGFIHFKLS